MTTPKADERLKQGATLWQLIYGIVATIVIVTAFILSIRADVASAIKENVRQDQTLEKLLEKQQRLEERTDTRQREILDKLNDIQLQLKDKQDRR